MSNVMEGAAPVIQLIDVHKIYDAGDVRVHGLRGRGSRCLGYCSRLVKYIADTGSTVSKSGQLPDCASCPGTGKASDNGKTDWERLPRFEPDTDT